MQPPGGPGRGAKIHFESWSRAQPRRAKPGQAGLGRTGLGREPTRARLSPSPGLGRAKPPQAEPSRARARPLQANLCPDRGGLVSTIQTLRGLTSRSHIYIYIYHILSQSYPILSNIIQSYLIQYYPNLTLSNLILSATRINTTQLICVIGITKWTKKTPHIISFFGIIQ